MRIVTNSQHFSSRSVDAKTAVFRKAMEDSEILLELQFYGLHYIADVIYTDVEIIDLFGDATVDRNEQSATGDLKVGDGIEAMIMKIIMRINEQ